MLVKVRASPVPAGRSTGHLSRQEAGEGCSSRGLGAQKEEVTKVFQGRDFTGHISSRLPVRWDQLAVRQTQRDPRMKSSLLLCWATWGFGIRILKNYLEAQLIATGDNSSEGAPVLTLSSSFVHFFS